LNRDFEKDLFATQVFQQHHKYIRRHNTEHEQALHSYKLGHNLFSHLHRREFSRTHKGLYAKEESYFDGYDYDDYFDESTFSNSGGGGSDKVVVDWRRHIQFNPIQDQGESGINQNIIFINKFLYL
jgi:hypothetical protein